MSYFRKNFPKTAYDMFGDKKYRRAVDIVKSFTLSDQVKQESSVFFNYIVKDSDRPDTIATKIYGRPDLHWLVLFANDIQNIYEEWPKDQVELENFVSKRYPGKSLFITPVNTNIAKKTYAIGSHVTGPYSSSLGVTAQATVIGWDINFDELIVDSITGSFSANDTIEIISTDNAVRQETVNKVVDTTDAVHHFVDSSGNYQDPYGATSVAGTSLDLVEGYKQGTLQSSYNIRTNREYEEEENETKRGIKLVKSSFVEPILKDLDSLFT